MMLAINPYAELGLYAPSVVARYGQFGDGPPPPPHIFGVAAEAFKGMLAGGSQSILVAGESGAGKTESCRRVLQYLAHREGSRRPGAGGEGGEGAASRGPATARSAQLHDELVRSNCVLEALGNARTVMNDNSSRFGKFLMLQYGVGARLAGATVSTSNPNLNPNPTPNPSQVRRYQPLTLTLTLARCDGVDLPSREDAGGAARAVGAQLPHPLWAG